MQRSFIENFEKLRNQDNKGLLISATGTGKTFAAAFAMKSIGAKRLLFIVHREQIARRHWRHSRLFLELVVAMVYLQVKRKI